MEEQLPDQIAIIGIGCRLPGGADSPRGLWELLREGRSAWSDVPSDRFRWQSFHHPHHELSGATNHRGGHFLRQDVTAFDATFFGISSAEATAMDPQQRIQLETCYEALENAGIPLERCRASNTAVYMAIFSHDYNTMVYKDLEDIPRYNAVGSGAAILSNRISHAFDLRGPSMTIDTGCSGSMVALHQACQSLRARESDMALAGGVNLILAPDIMVTMSMMQLVYSNAPNMYVAQLIDCSMLSNDGKSYSFDERGEGYGRGEGAGVVVLKRLSDALRDNDPIRAVIRNTATNFDGRTAGVTLPSSEAQYQLLQSVYRSLNPLDTGYCEAHGTGTVAGDSAEFKAITRLFSTKDRRKATMLLGSIKSNIGHLEAASGVAGLIKAVLVLENGMVPPNANFVSPKDGIALGPQGFKIPSGPQPWPIPGLRRASVNSFGYGGTNVHAILECFEPKINDTTALTNGALGSSNSSQNHSGDCDEDDSNFPQLFVLSASSKFSLTAAISSLKAWLSRQLPSAKKIRDLAYTLATRRSLLSWRFAFTAQNYNQLISILNQKSIPSVDSRYGARLTFAFTGQGAQWHAMGAELMKIPSAFTNSMHASDTILKRMGAPWSLLDELSRDELNSQVHKGRIGQPATTAIQIALVDLLEALRVKPTAVVGHSSGEIAAAYAAGAISHEAALLIAYARSSLSELSSKRIGKRGAMLAVGLGESEVFRYLDQFPNGRVCVACVNSPSSTTLSGDEDAIEQLMDSLKASNTFCRQLKVDTAYHSHYMQAVADDYLVSLQGLQTSPPASDVLFVSTVTGGPRTTDFGPSYWVQNLTSQVRFSDAMASLSSLQEEHQTSRSNEQHIVLEIGPHSALSGPIRQCLLGSEAGLDKCTYVPTLVRRHDAYGTILDALGKLTESGYRADIEQANALALSKPYELELSNGNSIGSGDAEGRPDSIKWRALPSRNLTSASRASVVTDLEPYPWDHSKKYWHESRLSRDFRFRAHSRHDLLGTRIVSNSPFEPAWRNLLNMDNLPWLCDHMINGAVVFPASAYLCMALEASRQLLEERCSSDRVAWYNFKKVSFLRALVIPEAPAKVEVQLTLKPPPHTADNVAQPWHTFFVYGVTNGVWHEHCTGLISMELDQSQNEIVHSPGNQDATSDKWDEIGEICAKTASIQALPADVVYGELKAMGNDYGPSFGTLDDLRIDNFQATAQLQVFDVSKSMPAHYMSEYPIHPATIDALFHSVIPVYIRTCCQESVMVSSIDELSISATVSHEPGELLDLVTSIKAYRSHTASVRTTAYQRQDRQRGAIFKLTRGEIRGTNQNQAATSDPQTGWNPSHQLEWRPDVDFATAETLRPVRENEAEVQRAAEKKMRLVNKATSIYLRRCLTDIDFRGLKILDNHMSKFVDWMRHYVHTEYCQQILSDMTNEAEEQACLAETVQAGTEGEMVTQVGNSLTSIVTGKIEALSALLQDDLLYRMYSDDSVSRCYEVAAKYFRLLSFKNPASRVIEIGAGTGSTTVPLLQSIDRNGRLAIGHYDFTDISSGFFERAGSLLQPWISNVGFKTLNIETDPEHQGFTPHSYDCVIAANVLHATRTLNETLSNVYKLLKPGGKLILIEVTREVPAYFMTFGMLPSWWLGEHDGRKSSPLVSTAQWNDLLLSANFIGAQIIVNDYAGDGQRCSVIISGRPDMPDSLPAPIKLVSALPEDTGTSNVPTHMQKHLNRLGLHSTIDPSPDFTTPSKSIFVILDDADKPLLARNTAGALSFASLQRLFSHKNYIFWITVRVSPQSDSNRFSSLINGFVRTARFENESLNVVLLDLDITAADSALELAAQLIQKRFASSSAQQLGELEYKYKGGHLLIPRLLPDSATDAWMARSLAEAQLVKSPINQTERALKMQTDQPGWLEESKFIEHDDCAGPIDDADIEIAVRAFSVTRQDAEAAAGHSKATSDLLGQASGVVTAVGKQAAEKFQVGDRVVCISCKTSFTNLTRANSSLAAVLPASVQTFEDGCTFASSCLTAYLGLTTVARLERAQRLLIYGADDEVGQALLVLASYIGAQIFATADSEDHRRRLIQDYSLDESRVFLTRMPDARRHVLRLTREQGVDVIINNICGSYEDLVDCLAPLGTLVNLNPSSQGQRQQASIPDPAKDVTVTSFSLGTFLKHRSRQVSDALHEILSLVDLGRLANLKSVNKFDVEQMRDAFKHAIKSSCYGKVVVRIGNESLVNAVQVRPQEIRLERNATFVVAGGLGGLGLRLCNFLAKHGASHLLVLTKRWLSPLEKAKWEQELSIDGLEAHVLSCSIENNDSVTKAKVYCNEKLPPVRGVVNMTVASRNVLVDQITWDDFQTGIAPKVSGTLNLYHAFKDTLSSFVVLSSVIAIIGSEGLASYGAANAFLDDFAVNFPDPEARVATFNLGPVFEAGALTKRSDARNIFTKQNLSEVTLREIDSLFSYVLGGQALKDGRKQLIVGFNNQPIADIDTLEMMPDPRFLHLPPSSQESTASAINRSFVRIEELVASANTFDSAYDIILQAVIDKISKLTIFEADENNLNRPLAELGLDSLVVTELRNWVVRTIQVAVTTFEISDAPSVKKLVQMLAERKIGGSTERAERQQPPGNGQTNGIKKTSEAISPIQSLPILPLPTLEETFENFLEENRALGSETDLLKSKQAIAEFLAPDSVGRRLQARLEDAKAHSDNWIVEAGNRANWLGRQANLVPFCSFFGTHYLSAAPHSQAERAALITVAAARYRDDLLHHRVAPNPINEEPTCGELYKNIFDSVRRPRVGPDQIINFPPSDHIVALRHGRVFKVSILRNGALLSFANLRRTFEAILQNVKEPTNHLGILTTDLRDPWGRLYSMLQELSAENRESIATIERAAFVVCLDDSIPSTPTGRVKEMFWGHGSNRWHDKSSQFIVAVNGASASIFEHAMMDGPTVKQLGDCINEAIFAYQPVHLNGHGLQDTVMVEECKININPEIESRISEAHQNFLKNVAPWEYYSHSCSGLGNAYFRSFKLPPKSAGQILIQIASRIHFGYQPASWETVTLHHFHKGRIDIHQAISPPVAAFLDTICEPDGKEKAIPAGTNIMAIFSEATASHSAAMTRISRGKGFDRHLSALRETLEAGEELPPFFNDPLYTRTRPRKIMATCSDSGVEESAYVLRDPESIWCQYELEEDRCRLNIVGSTGKAEAFCACLDKAAAMLLRILG